MKNILQFHLPKKQKEISEIWTNAIFVFDTNTMLNFYRYSDLTRNEFFEVLKSLKARVWLPEQVSKEFLKNRLNEISNQAKAYDLAIENIKNLREQLTSSRGHPFISEEGLAKYKNAMEELEVELTTNREQHLTRIHNDDIIEKLSEIFDGNIGNQPSNDEIEKIILEGIRRMGEYIPPGYADYPKHKEPKTQYEKRSNVGDYILWRQTMDHALDKKKPICLVTDDAKEDWWLRANGKTIGPRKELEMEFEGVTGQRFLMYRTDQFLKYAKDHLRANVSSETLDEIKESSKWDRPHFEQGLPKHVFEVDLSSNKENRKKLFRYLSHDIKNFEESAHRKVLFEFDDITKELHLSRDRCLNLDRQVIDLETEMSEIPFESNSTSEIELSLAKFSKLREKLKALKAEAHDARSRLETMEKSFLYLKDKYF